MTPKGSDSPVSGFFYPSPHKAIREVFNLELSGFNDRVSVSSEKYISTGLVKPKLETEGD